MVPRLAIELYTGDGWLSARCRGWRKGLDSVTDLEDVELVEPSVPRVRGVENAEQDTLAAPKERYQESPTGNWCHL